MRRLLIIILLNLIVGGFNVMAGNKLTKTGYMGNASITVSAQGPGCIVTTSHGYSFGNGLWMGGGIGLSFSDYYDSIYLPVFAEVKYSFTPEKKVSPFVDCRLGYMTELDNMFGYINPAFGIDFNRCSVFTSYNNLSSNINTVHFGFAFNF